MIKKLLFNLITKKFYSKEDIMNKCDVFFAMNRISAEEYSELMLKIEEDYFVQTVEEVVTEQLETAEQPTEESEVNE